MRRTASTGARGVARSGIVVLFCLLTAGAAFYHFFTQRPGEAALRLIPRDALLATTLDTRPSPGQVALFRRIHALMPGEHASASLERAIAEATRNAPAAQEVRPYLDGSFAFALLKSPVAKRDADWVLIAGTKEPRRAAGVLTRRGRARRIADLAYWSLEQPDVCAVMIRSYVVVAGRAEALAQVQAVAQGRIAPLDGERGFREARDGLPGDANLLLFIAPSAPQAVARKVESGPDVKLLGDGWCAMSGTLRDDGIEVRWTYPDDDAGRQHRAPPPTLDLRVLNRLPAGAYALTAVSRPARFWDTAAKIAGDDPKSHQALAGGIAAFEKATGVNVARDLLPGLNGDAALAIYPSAADGRGMDGLLVLNDARQADPARLAAKARAYIVGLAAGCGQDNQGARFRTGSKYGAPVWWLDNRSDDAISSAAFSSFLSSDWGPSGKKIPTSPVPAVPYKGFSPATKGLFEADVGRTVLLASSPAMMDKALLAWGASGPGRPVAAPQPLAADPDYRRLIAKVPSGAQSMTMVDLPRAMEALRPVLASMRSEGSGTIDVDDAVRLFGYHGLLAAQTDDGRCISGTLFLPLDYERATRLFSALSHPGGTKA